LAKRNFERAKILRKTYWKRALNLFRVCLKFLRGKLKAVLMKIFLAALRL
jgi:hypothetical protein